MAAAEVKSAVQRTNTSSAGSSGGARAPASAASPAPAAGAAAAEAVPRECRICLMGDADADPSAGAADELIAPCLCKGSSKWIHRQCLDHWRAVKMGQAFTHCGTCHFKYKIREIPNDDAARQRRSLWRFRFFVARDLSAAAVALLFVVAVTAWLLRATGVGAAFNAWLKRSGSADTDDDADFDDAYDATGGYASSAEAAAARAQQSAAAAAAAGTAGGSVVDPITFGGYMALAVVVLLMALGVVALVAWAMGRDIGVGEGLQWWSRTCQCECHAGSCRCGTCHCNGCVGGGGGGGCLPVLAAVLFVVGLVVALGVGATLVNRTVSRHVHILWLREETQRFVVEDLAGREHLIERFYI